jgi:phage gp36-like protein
MGGRRISELFYELRANTEGLKRDLDDGQRQLGKFSQFVERNPTAVVGALGVALAGIGIEATHMAERTEGALRRITVNIPEGIRGLEELRASLRLVADESGRSRDETLSLFETISKQGVSSAAEIETRARAIQKFADATNAATDTTAAGLDQLMDSFGITADGAELALAKIASVAKGRTDVQSVMDALQAAAPTIAKFGLDFDTSIKALTQLMDGYGLSAAQAGKLLKGLDSTELKNLAKDAHISADALKEMNERADIARDGLDRLANKAKNDLNEALEELGTKLLPLVSSELKGLNGILNLIDGSIDRITSKTSAGVITNLGARPNLSPADVQRLREAYNDVPADVASGVLDFKRMGLAELKDFYDGLEGAVRRFGDQNDQIFGSILSDVGILIAEKERLEKPAPGANGTAGTATRKPRPLTAEEKKALEEAAQKAQEASEKVRQIFAGLAQDVSVEVSGVTSTAFAKAIADLDKFVAEAATKRVELVKALKASNASPEDQAGALQFFDLQVKVGRAERTAAAQAILDRERTDATNDFRVTLAALTNDAIAQMDEADRALRESKRAAGYSPEQLQQLAAVQAQLRDAKVAVKAVDDALANLGNRAAAGFVKPLDEMRELSQQELVLATARQTVNAKTATTDEERRAKQAALKLLDEEQLKIDQRRDELADKNVKHTQEVAEYEAQFASHAHDAATALESAADIAYGLISALGLGDSTLGHMVVSVGQLAKGLQQATSADFSKLGTFAKLGVVGSIIGGAIGIAQSIGGLFSKSPEQVEHERVVKENTLALQHLSEKVGLLGSVNLKGATANTALDVSRLLVATDFMNDVHSPSFQGRLVRKEWDQLTAEQREAFKDAAKELGITIDGSAEMFQQAVRAILDAAGELGEFGADFDSFTRQAEAARKIFGTDNPAQRLTDLATAATKASPAIAKLFEGLDLAKPADLETLRQRVQDFFAIMESGGEKLSAADLGDLTGDQLVQFLENIIEGIGAITPAAQSAAEKMTAARQQLGTEFEILGDDAKTQLGKIATVYGAQGGALAQLVAGLDPASTASVQLLEDRIQALFKQLQSAPDSVDLAGLSLDQFLQVLLDLKRGADAAAGGVEDAAARMQKAAQALQTDFEVYGTDAVSQAAQLAQLYAGVGGIGGALAGIDFSTVGGRGAAVTALQQLYGQDKGNDDAVQAILEILRALRAVPAEQSGSGAKPTTESSGAERITIEQADRLISLTESLLVFGRQTAQNTAALAALLRPPANAPVQAPVLPNAFLAGGAGSQVKVEVRLMVVNHFYGPVGAGAGAAANELGTQIGQGASDVLDVALGNSLQRWDQVRGSPFARVGV